MGGCYVVSLQYAYAAGAHLPSLLNVFKLNFDQNHSTVKVTSLAHTTLTRPVSLQYGCTNFLLQITPTHKTRIHKVSEKNHYALNVLKRLQNKLEVSLLVTKGVKPLSFKISNCQNHEHRLDPKIFKRFPPQGREGAVILPLEEQVTSVIASATSSFNLSHMYEGWTPWV